MKVYFVMCVDTENGYDERHIDIFKSYKRAQEFFNSCVELNCKVTCENNEFTQSEAIDYIDNLHDEVPNDYVDACCDPDYEWCVYLGEAEYHTKK